MRPKQINRSSTARFNIIRQQTGTPSPGDMNIGIYVGHAEIFGVKATINDLTQLLSRINIHDVLRTLVTLNNIYCSDTLPPRNLKARQTSIAQELFSKENFERILKSVFGLTLTVSSSIANSNFICYAMR
jgi:hypothetical protein